MSDELYVGWELYVGCTVTVYPKVGRGESVDTEPGLQPWDAQCVGWTDEKVILAVDPEFENYFPGCIRLVERDSVRFKS